MRVTPAAVSVFLWTARSAAFGLPKRTAKAALTTVSTAAATCPVHRAFPRGGAVFSTKAAIETAPPVEIFRKDYRPLPFTVDTIDLDFDIKPGTTTVHSKLTLLRNHHADSHAHQALVLDGDETCIKLRSIRMNGKQLVEGTDYTLEPGKLLLWNVQDGAVLETLVDIVPEDNTQLSGLYKSGSMYCTQCEAMGFRRITYFPDRPDNMSKYRVKITAEAQNFPVLLSNGNLLEQGTTENGRHYALWEDPFRKPSYLFALVAGNLGCIKDTYRTKSGQQVQLAIFSEHENVNKLHYAMDSLKRSMKWDEARFGLEYDLGIYNIVATQDFNMGAMVSNNNIYYYYSVKHDTTFAHISFE